MSTLPILEYPDPRLRTRAVPVTNFDARLKTLVDDMFQTMYEAPGIGLAASQVDVHQRLIVIDVSKDRTEPLVFINPEIIARAGLWMNEEGCLSVPGIFEEVERAETIEVCARKADGTAFEMRLEGLVSTACSMKWIISRGSFSSTICPISNVSAFAGSLRKIAKSAPAAAHSQRRAYVRPSSDFC